jgi:aldose 1-epimerase
MRILNGLLTGVLLMTSLVTAAEPAPEGFGKTKDGVPVELHTIGNKSGFSAKIMTRGATLVSLMVPDASGKLADVLLGFDSVTGYESDGNQYFGCTTGRVCNRIAKGRFTLDGREYTLAINNEPNHLHGGLDKALDKLVWKAEPMSSADGQGVKFSVVSPDGDEGYPGKLEVTVTYFIPADTNRITISYSGRRRQPHRAQPRTPAQRRILHTNRRHSDPHRQDRSGRRHRSRFHQTHPHRCSHRGGRKHRGTRLRP